MASGLTGVDPAFQGAGKTEGLEIWRIEDFKPVPVPKASYGKFFSGDSYIVLKSTKTQSGSLDYDLHYWLGKETSQDESGTAAIKAVELDDHLGGKAVQYRETQGNETQKFLSYFKPCIVPQPGGFKSGFKHVKTNEQEHTTRLYMCCTSGHNVHVKEVPVERSSLNHNDIFILDTASKIYQFNGHTSSIHERGKAFEVVQYIKETFHEGVSDTVRVEDTETVDDPDATEFWKVLGGFGPIAEKGEAEGSGKDSQHSAKLFRIKGGKLEPLDHAELSSDLLDPSDCFLLDCGVEIYLWIGKKTSLEERKHTTEVTEKMLHDPKHKNTHVTRVIDGHEPLVFKDQFTKWDRATEAGD